jgi:hypothetical protein
VLNLIVDVELVKGNPIKKLRLKTYRKGSVRDLGSHLMSETLASGHSLKRLPVVLPPSVLFTRKSQLAV